MEQDPPPTIQEIGDALKSMPIGKAPGDSGDPRQLLKRGGRIPLSFLVSYPESIILCMVI